GGKAGTGGAFLLGHVPFLWLAHPPTGRAAPKGGPPLLGNRLRSGSRPVHARPAIAGRKYHLAAIACERGHRGGPMRCARTGRPELSAPSPARASGDGGPSRPGAGGRRG